MTELEASPGQREAQGYFERASGLWSERARAHDSHYNVIEARRELVLSQLERETTHGISRALDAGCGSGELACELAARGIRVEGVDFAPSLVEAAQSLAARSAVGERARFTCASIFDYRLEPGAYDLVTANGFIEYLSPGERDRFFQLTATALRPGGWFFVDFRNRLFNLFSTNAYTQEEAELGTLSRLLAESRLCDEAPDGETWLAALRGPLEPWPSPIRHPSTGIEVSVRWQYVPSEMVRRLEAQGFRVIAIYPLHPHLLPPALARRFPEWHGQLAREAIVRAPSAPAMIPRSSSALLQAVRLP